VSFDLLRPVVLGVSLHGSFNETDASLAGFASGLDLLVDELISMEFTSD